MHNNFEPKISVIIPVFNGAAYVREAIESALSQTYKNTEIIVVDDGSTDETEAICISYSEEIHYHRKANGGCASALNVAIRKSKGDYISWLSHDDVYPQYKLEKQVAQLSLLSNKQTILYGPYELINEASEVIARVIPHLEKHPINKLNKSLYPLFKGLINGCTMLIPRACFDNVGYFDETLLATQDYDLWLRFLKVYPVAYCLKPMVRTRLHSEQGSKKIPSNIEECNRLWSHMLDSIGEHEMLSIEPSVYSFYSKTADFLATTPYTDACAYYKKRISEYVDNIKVSVVIPFKDRFDLLIEAVDSVKSQTHRNIELVLVDDGSDDECPIIPGYFDGVEIIYSKQDNQGPASARNLGVCLATAQYIAFLDSDDLFVSNKIRTQLIYMLTNSVDLTYTSYDRIDLDGKIPTVKIDSGGVFKKELPELIVNCPIATPTIMAKREVLLKHRFPTEYNVGEDVSCWLSIAAECKIQGIPDSLTKVRTSGSSASISHQKQIIGLLNIARYVASTCLYDRYPESLRELIQICADYVKDNICYSDNH